MMNDYNSLYTWAMDKHAQLEREATQRRLVRHSRSVSAQDKSRLRWPLARRRDDQRKAA